MSKQMNSALAQGDQTEVICIGSNELLIAKEVEFLGDHILVVKDEELNKVYAGIGYICKGIGLSQGQTNNEVNRVKNDIVLSKGSRNLVSPTKGGNQEVICIELDYLPLWLAKISITPKMKDQQPELVDKIVNYQLKAKDVLASVFVHNVDPLAGASPELRAILMHDEKLQVVDTRLTNLENNMTLDHGQQQTLNEMINRKVVSTLGGKGTMAYKLLSKKTFPEVYRALKNTFQVPSYRDIPVKQFEKAKELVNLWKPSADLNLMIIGANAQVTLNE